MNTRVFAADVRFAWRSMVRRRGSAAGTVLVFASGIGLATAMFAIADPFLFRPLPYAAPGQLALIEVAPECISNAAADPYTPTLDEWRARTTLFEAVAAYSPLTVSAVEAGAGAATFDVVAVTSNFFDVLGVRAPPLDEFPRIATGSMPAFEVPVILTAAGSKALTEEKRRPGALLHARNGYTFRVYGTLSPELLFPDPGWRRYSALTVLEPGRIVPPLALGCCPRVVLARLRPGVRLGDVAAALEPPRSAGRQLTLRVGRISDLMRAEVRPLALGGFVVSVLLLLICAADIANLSLVRRAYRAHEFDTRRALGASPGDIARLCAVESLMTTGTAVTVGIGIACFAVSAVARVIPAQFAVLGVPAITPRVIAFAMLVGLTITSVVLVPAAYLTPFIATRSMRARHASAAVRVGFAGVQAALAMILAVGASMLVESYVNLIKQDPGYERSAVYVEVSYPPGTAGLLENVKATVAAVERLPGVGAAAAAQGSIVLDAQSMQAVAVNGQVSLQEVYTVTPGFFAAAGMSVVRGRALVPSDGGSRGVVVNEAFARRHWPSSPVGEVLRFVGSGRQAEIVGIVRNALVHGPAMPPTPTIYTVLDDQRHLGFGSVYYVIRSGGQPPSYEQIRRAIAGVNRNSVIGRVDTIGSRLTDAVRDRTFATLLLSLFALAGGTMSIAGLVVVVAFVVARRTREFAIRMTLGASGQRIRRLAIGEAVAAAAGGGAAGMLIGRWLSMWLESLVFGIKAGNWTTTLAAGSAMMSIMIVAALVPARRAVRLQPSDALRSE